MTKQSSSELCFLELRDRLKARADKLEHACELNLQEILKNLVALPDDAHTSDSIDALIHLSRNLQHEAQVAEALEAASHAARLAAAQDHKLHLCTARIMEAIAFGLQGRFSEAAVAQIDAWSLARALGETKREGGALCNFAALCVGMGQYDVAIRYYERSRDFAEKHGFPDMEFLSRNGIADCAVQLREPSAGLEALAQLNTYTPQYLQDTVILGSAHNTLARLHLLAGNVVEAQYHADESARLAQISGDEARNTRSTDAVLGLIDVYLGRTETGLSKLQDGLDFALQVCRNDVPDYLGMQIDAYEFAGYSDKALECLWELVAWKRKFIDEKVASLQCEGLVSPVHLDASALNGDNRLLARAHSLQSRVHDCIQHFIEMGINADIACGYDLYRSFRLAKLALCFADTLGWEKWRVAPLVLGMQLSNIGMIAVPARILLKAGSLSAGERVVINDHTRYGAELLRRSKLASLEIASVIAAQHHERYDGSGYPNFLAGESIAEEARMAAICDAFDAMTHSRPWRATPMSKQEAMGELEKGAGNQFDPQLVSAFIDLAQSELGRHEDLDAFLTEGANSIEYVRARARLEALAAADTANSAVNDRQNRAAQPCRTSFSTRTATRAP